MKIYDGHGNEETFTPGKPEGLPCCEDGVCDQHLDEYLASRGYYYQSGRRYHVARERARERLNYMRREKVKPTA